MEPKNVQISADIPIVSIAERRRKVSANHKDKESAYPSKAFRRFIRRSAAVTHDVICELLWPTRCAICDMQGERVLCENCESLLQHIDEYKSCPLCGAPFSRIQCTECNTLMLDSAGLNALPFERMSHSVILDDAAKRIVTVYKDQDERRLACDIARILARKIAPEELRESFVISFIPDTAAAIRRRGFDHSEELARKLADLTGLHCKNLFARPESSDQRALGRSDRIANMRCSLKIDDKAEVPGNILLIDDVCTTGATIYSACLALKASGAKCIHVLTFGVVLE